MTYICSMKNLYLILFAIVFFMAGCSASKTFKAPKGFQFIPPGEYTVKNDTIEKTITINAFWISNEITNKEFREFVTDLQLNPDSAVYWVDLKQAAKRQSEDGKEGDYAYYYKRTYSEMLENIMNSSLWANSKSCINRFYDKKSDDYPIVGINYRAATDYCLWRSIKDKKANNNYSIEYRLPKEIEWEYAASGGDTESIMTDDNITLIKVNKGKKNPFGLRNMNSNVSEFVYSANRDDSILIKGSSWKKSLKPDERITESPEFVDNATGFRIVMSFIGRKSL